MEDTTEGIGELVFNGRVLKDGSAIILVRTPDGKTRAAASVYNDLLETEEEAKRFASDVVSRYNHHARLVAALRAVLMTLPDMDDGALADLFPAGDDWAGAQASRDMLAESLDSARALLAELDAKEQGT